MTDKKNLAFALLCTLAAACSSSDKPAADRGPAEVGPADGTMADGAPADSAVDTGPPPFALNLKTPFTAPTSDPLANESVSGCSLYQEERCTAGRQERCALYDTTNHQFVDTPDALLHRALLYDRWYDLYHQPDGMSFSRQFNAATPAGTAESVWGDSTRFSNFGNRMDAPIWSGVALIGFAARYLSTATQSDYQRMEDKARALLLHFEVTGIPGYLARHHLLVVPDDVAQSDQHLFMRESAAADEPHLHPIADGVQGLPAIYSAGVRRRDGSIVQGQPSWRGGPSIDQYSGVLSAFATVFSLLRDQTLKDRMAHHVGCFVKRLQRIEIQNLQQNPEAIAAVVALLSGEGASVDPEDVDFTKLDTVVAYVSPQYNVTNAESFDKSCPNSIAQTPSLVLDASSSNFLLDLLALAGRMVGQGAPPENAIDFIHVANVRGGNAIQLLQLMAAAYMMTGDEQCRRFAERELMGNLNALDVADTASVLVPPDWCRAFHGDHIVYLPLWSLLTMLEDSPARDRLAVTMDFEMYQKRMKRLGNANFQLYYAGELDESEASERATAITEAVAALKELGGNGGVLDDPRRRYSQSYAQVAAALGSDLETTCPTESQREFCEQGFTVFGVPIPGEPITFECTGAASECSLTGGCAGKHATKPLPMRFRPWGDFIWQKNPFEIDLGPTTEGLTQSAGLELSQSYWVARAYGFIDEGAGQVLAWRDVGTCP